MEASYSLSKAALIFLIILLLLKNVIAASQPSYVFTSCDTDSNYTQNSLFQKNLYNLLEELGRKAAQNDFYNTTKGETSDIVYGSFYCRGDTSLELCHDCVKAAATTLVKNCTSSIEAVSWYEECTLRYGVAPDDGNGYSAYWRSPFNVSNPIELQKVLSTKLNSFFERAAYNGTYNGYVTGEASFQQYRKVYVLVQCSPEIVGLSCERCLGVAYRDMQVCCNGGRTWLMYFETKCQIRYDMAPFYTPLASPPTLPVPQPSSSPADKKGVVFYITRAVVPAVGLLLLVLCAIVLFMYRRRRKQPKPITEVSGHVREDDQETFTDQSSNSESLQYSLDIIKSSTRNFDDEYKLGQGGFGAVYKGRLPDGQEVAVKRLSEDSRQGFKEFINEVKLVANLQHRNLVQLLGFCLEGDEKLLIYEYVPNLSLDKLLYDPNKRKYLDWETRFKIITGIARGLFYLHVDSRIKIIHRDLKSSNILLDEHMNPKIADFGLARLMKIDNMQSNTSKIFGTFGYMAPEYALAGVFSAKSDVYSFGVIVLEIISGQSNSLFKQTRGSDSLISYASRLWNMGTILEIVDPLIRDNFSRTEVLNCIQVGIFCVQEDPSTRPTMESILPMLHNNSSDMQIQSSHFVTSPSKNVRRQQIRGEQDRFDSQEYDQSYNRDTTSQYNTDLYPR